MASKGGEDEEYSMANEQAKLGKLQNVAAAKRRITSNTLRGIEACKKRQKLLGKQLVNS